MLWLLDQRENQEGHGSAQSWFLMAEFFKPFFVFVRCCLIIVSRDLLQINECKVFSCQLGNCWTRRLVVFCCVYYVLWTYHWNTLVTILLWTLNIPTWQYALKTIASLSHQTISWPILLTIGPSNFCTVVFTLVFNQMLQWVKLPRPASLCFWSCQSRQAFVAMAYYWVRAWWHDSLLENASNNDDKHICIEPLKVLQI